MADDREPAVPETSPPKKRLRHRIPVSVRQHWQVVAIFVVFVVVLATVFGTTRIRPYVTGDQAIIASEITENITGVVDLFDDSEEHMVSIDITDAEYQDMITAYREDGEKKWTNATVTIDGTVISDASVRLKGNSTLMGLRGGGRPGPGGEGGEAPTGMEPPAGLELPDGFEPPAGMGPPEGMELPEGMQPPTDGQMPGGGMGGMMGGAMGSVSADDPNSLPLLISFDENAKGRAYQGLTEISVRPGSPVINEAMALSLTAETGQASQRYAYSVYSVNGTAGSTRLLLEHPDSAYADTLFDSPGYLYKADANSKMAYVDDDQASYTSQFKLLNASGTGDVQPIINFLRWLDGADDEEFDEHLGDWVDVDSFAQYLATQNLLVNFDDMSGPGQNYYLWYDLETKKITVVTWDLNLAMTGQTTSGPDDTLSMGGGGEGARPGVTATDGQRQQRPADIDTRPAAPVGQDNTQPAAKGHLGAGGGGMRGGNPLKTRFLASDAFTAVYESAYWDLYDQIYASGLAEERLDALAESIPTSDGLTAQDLRSGIERMRTWITTRSDNLTALR